MWLKELTTFMKQKPISSAFPHQKAHCCARKHWFHRNCEFASKCAWILYLNYCFPISTSKVSVRISIPTKKSLPLHLTDCYEHCSVVLHRAIFSQSVSNKIIYLALLRRIISCVISLGALSSQQNGVSECLRGAVPARDGAMIAVKAIRTKTSLRLALFWRETALPDIEGRGTGVATASDNSQGQMVLIKALIPDWSWKLCMSVDDSASPSETVQLGRRASSEPSQITRAVIHDRLNGKERTR